MSSTGAFGEPKAQTSQKVRLTWFERDPRWLLAQRIAATQPFVRSRFLSGFLLYIVTETLEDRSAEITEHQIGVHVFERSEDYRSSEDNIVRTYARQLRKRLGEYFADEGASEPLRVDVPIGGYVPVFRPSNSNKRSQEADARHRLVALPPPPLVAVESPGPRKPAIRRGWRTWTALLTAVAAYSALLVWGASLVERHFWSREAAPVGAESTAPLWTALFGGPANCYVVPADAGFNLIEDMTHQSLPLASYVRSSYLQIPLTSIDEHSADNLRGQRFTSFVDLETVAALARLPQFNPRLVTVRFPRDLQLDDLRNSNAVILGSISSNPWAAVAESNANFRIVNGPDMHDASVTNLNPQPGEDASYVSHWDQPSHETYAVIAFLPNLSGSGHLLLIQGLDVAGTEAAAETLFHADLVSPVLRRALRSDGSLRSFEILLRSESIGSRSTRAEVVATRVY